MDNPTYQNLGDHTEVFQVDYDPELLTYQDILKVFWNNHDPTTKSWSRQYQAMILYHNEEQREAAGKSKTLKEQSLGTAIYTEIKPLDKFYLAEDYHQKYYLQNIPELASEMRRYYPLLEDFVNSTVVARLNGIAGGYVDLPLLEKEFDSYGLSSHGRDIVEDIVY